MKNNIKGGIFYDDPTRKNLSQVDTVMGMSEAFSLLTGGVNKLEELSRSLILDEKLRKEILQSAQVIVTELQRLHPIMNEFVQKTKGDDITKTDRIIGGLGGGVNGPISMNETTHGKIQSTINRIKEVNKKINRYGTKSN